MKCEYKRNDNKSYAGFWWLNLVYTKTCTVRGNPCYPLFFFLAVSLIIGSLLDVIRVSSIKHLVWPGFLYLTVQDYNCSLKVVTIHTDPISAVISSLLTAPLLTVLLRSLIPINWSIDHLNLMCPNLLHNLSILSWLHFLAALRHGSPAILSALPTSPSLLRA